MDGITILGGTMILAGLIATAITLTTKKVTGTPRYPSPPPPPKRLNNTTMTMTHKPFYMIYVEGERTPTYIHSNLESAEAEAKRLAETLEKRAYILMSIKSYELNKFKEIVYELDNGDHLPF